MKRLATMLGLALLAVGSLIGVRSAEAEPEPLRAPEGNAVVEPAVVTEAPAPPAANTVRGRGLVCSPVPELLASHLGIAPGECLIVVTVQEGSLADGAGLRPHDVVLTIDQEVATGTGLDAALSSERGLALGIVRGGEPQTLPLAGTGGDDDAFLSTDSLGPDHPFRRVAQVKALREMLSAQSEANDQRRHELDEEAREVRDQAKAAIDELHDDAMAEVSAFLEERRAELLEVARAEISQERVVPLRALRVELTEVLSAESIAAVDASLEELHDSLRSTLGEQLVLPAGEDLEEERQRLQKRVAKAGKAAAELLSERVRRPWSEARDGVPQHGERLGPKHDGRVEWTEKTVAAIHAEVVERIDCAIDRAEEEFAKKLRARLSKMEVPAPGEIEASLESVAGQLDEMTRRFARRTTSALAGYEQQLERRPRVLVPELQRHLAASAAASEELSAEVAAVLQVRLAREIALDDTWRGRAAADALVDGLGAELTTAVNDGRDALRAGALAMVRALTDERIVSDDAWSDLKSRLSTIQHEAQSDCWKLDGPHLDGRFPKQRPRPRAEVTMAAR